MTSSVFGNEKKLQCTSQSQSCTQKSSWSLFGGCCLSDSLELSESWQNHYIWEVCSANQWDPPTTAVPAAGIRQQNGPNCYPWPTPDCMSHSQHFKSWTNWTTKFCLIHHIHLTSHQPTTIFSSISTTFCRENASTTSRRQKIISKSSSNPEAWIFTLQE